MSKYDNAGLAMIPSGYKASKVYSVIPNTTDGDFDFSRGSTATRVNKDGLIEVVDSNVPRLDYPLIDGVVQDCPSLLLEPSRTNLIQYSEDFSDDAWEKTDITVTSNNAISPNGTLNADKLERTSIGSYLKTDVSTSGEQSYTVFLKKGDLNFARLLAKGSGNPNVYFDLNNGTVGTETNAIGSIEYYGNGWYRCNIVYDVTITSVRIYVTENDDSTEGINGYIYLWGAQVEQGSYATSYIPTSGSTVTRVAETCNGAGTSDTFNASEGVLFVEMAALAREKTLFELISLSDGTTTNRMYLGFASGTNKLIWLYGASVFSGDTTSIETTNNNKIAFKFKDNDFAIWVNGVEIDSQLSGSTFSSNTFNTMGFDSGSGSATTRLYANLKQIIVFDSALTDAELQALTSN